MEKKLLSWVELQAKILYQKTGSYQQLALELKVAVMKAKAEVLERLKLDPRSDHTAKPAVKKDQDPGKKKAAVTQKTKGRERIARKNQ